MNPAALRAWLAVNHAFQIGPARFHQLLEVFAEPQAMLAASVEQLQALGLSAQTIAELKTPDEALLEASLRWCEQAHTHVLTWDDTRYPLWLRQVAAPPPVLYVRGDPAVLGLPQIAIVGSRHPTPAGAENARLFAAELTRAGFVITSGMALGIDAASHQGALQANGLTIAIMGTGLDRCYPAAHRSLAEAIVEKGGALVSEFPLGTKPIPGNFPRRNRLISGLSRGVLVVEAALRSGSLITAQHALEQGREVYAIPGSIHNTQAKGCHALLRQGAKLVETVADILEELPATFADISSSYVSPVPVLADIKTDELHDKVLAAIDDAPTGVDQIIERSGLTTDAVCSILLLLELQGRAHMTMAGQYCRVYDKGGR